MLELDHSKRIKASDALLHKFFDDDSEKITLSTLSEKVLGLEN